MSITDELREAAAELEVRHTHNDHDFTDLFYPHPSRREFLAIADCIDAEHEAMLVDARKTVYQGYIELPKDADGVPIHVGDVLTDGEYTFTVFELSTFGCGSWSIRNEDENAWKACDVTHHHKPTVEDVLREFAEKMAENTAMYVAESWDADERDEADAAAIAEYAAKLRLRKEDA